MPYESVKRSHRTFLPPWAVALLALVAALLLPRLAVAACVGPANDCNGDGVPNDIDPCPALTGAGNPGKIIHGFQDVACYLPLVDPNNTAPSPVKPFAGSSKCIPVAARRIDDTIPADALHPGSVSATTAIKGVIFVGVVESTSLASAKATVVAAGFKAGTVPADALFGCIGSIQFAPDGTLTQDVQIIYGYRLATSYTRAILQAGSNSIVAGKSFTDALGLIRSVTLGDAAWSKAVHGTNGTWSDKGDWTTDPAVFLASNDLPIHIDAANDKGCIASVQNAMQAASSLIETTPASVPPWAALPDPSTASFQSYPSAFASTAEYLASPDAKNFQWRATPFGPRPISTPLVGTPMPALKKNWTPPKPAPAKPPGAANRKKWGPPDQFADGGVVPTFDPSVYNGNPVTLPCTPTGFLCGCQVTALVFPPDQSYFDPTIDGAALFDAAKPFTRWSDFFVQQFPPFFLLRALDDVFALVGGDLAAWKTKLGGLVLDGGFPSWDLTSPFFTGGAYPPPFRFAFPPNATAPDPYKAGFLFRSPADAMSDWEFITGTGYEALAGLGVTDRAIADIWQWDVASSGWHGISVTLADGAPGFQSYDASAGTWTYQATAAAAQTDYADVSLPGSAWSTTAKSGISGFGSGVSVIASRHLLADAWHPGEDHWLTNYGNQADFTANGKQPPQLVAPYAKIGYYAGNASAWQWEPATVMPTAVTKYEDRVSLCSFDNYDPYEANAHWPRLGNPFAFAGLYGHVNEAPPAPKRPSAHFATDLISRPLVGTPFSPRLHEAMDVNWDYDPDYIQPEYRGLVGDLGGKYCYGTIAVADVFKEDLIQYAVSCNDYYVGLCGDEAYTGCNPTERIIKQFGEDCSGNGACTTKTWDCGLGPLDFICSWVYTAVTCAGALLVAGGKCLFAGYQGIYNEFEAYVGGGLCLVLKGKACSEGELTLWKTDSAPRELSIELEHRLTWGKLDGNDTCGYQGSCEFGTDYLPGNEIFTGDVTNKMTVVAINKDFAPIGSPNLYPLVLAPGVIGDRLFAFRSMAKTVSSPDPGASLPILPPTVAADLLMSAQGDPAQDRAFRFEAVGDLIVDCGHEPLKTEIHPPTNLLFHVSAVHPAMPQKRYGTFGWRRPESPDATADFDLWPGPRTRDVHSLTVSDMGARPAGTDALECAPYPPESPNRIRCKVPAGGAGNNFHCLDNPRMLPACAKTAAGGLYDVAWAP